MEGIKLLLSESLMWKVLSTKCLVRKIDYCYGYTRNNRDVIEEYINKGVLVRILDTAGIRETMDLVENRCGKSRG